MALIVEDGTGLPNAQVYQSVADFTAYCAAINRDLSDFQEPGVIEAALISGAQFVDTEWYYKGTVLSNDQAREFPRVGLVDKSGRRYTGVPQKVKDAQNEAAWIALSEALYTNSDRSAVLVETIGPISTTYAGRTSPDAPFQKTFTVVEMLLKPLTKKDTDIRRPLPFNGSANTRPIFGVGMMDNPEAGSCYGANGEDYGG